MEEDDFGDLSQCGPTENICDMHLQVLPSRLTPILLWWRVHEAEGQQIFDLGFGRDKHFD